jgi:hypothetical protein
MRISLPARLACLAALGLTLASCSISMPDASYIDAATEGFPEVAYPANRITGEWFKFGSGTLQYRANGKESRAEYHFRPGGSGSIREVSQFHGGDGKMDKGDPLIVLTAPIRWNHIGPNMWRVDVPDSKQFKVAHSEGARISGFQAAHSFRLRYKNGRLYDIDGSRTLVPKSMAREYIDQERRRIGNGEVMPLLIGPAAN